MSSVDFLVAFFTLASIKGMLAINVQNVTIPKMAVAGQSIDLFCKFDLQGMQLYAFRWFKDGLEFYRYLPKDTPSTRVFDNRTLGISVDTSLSDEGHVHLSNITLRTEGKYMCQVTSEKPNFRKKSASRRLSVLVLPKSRPKIKGKAEKYDIGDIVNLNCISAPSHPPANLSWAINSDKVEKEHLVATARSRNNDGLVYTTLTLRFKLEPSHLNTDGEAKLSCYAIIFPYYNSSTNEWISHKMVTTREFTLRDDPSVESPLLGASHTNGASAKRRSMVEPGCGCTSFLTDAQKVTILIVFIFNMMYMECF